jgi:hypothetical protein
MTKAKVEGEKQGDSSAGAALAVGNGVPAGNSCRMVAVLSEPTNPDKDLGP